jgi:hypothetical protein
MCIGQESNPGRLCCRRTLKQRAIRTAYILAVRNHYLCGDFTLLLSRGFSPRHMAPPSMFIERLDSLFTDNPGTHNVISINHGGVTTMEEVDQSSLLPLLQHLEANMRLARESNPCRLQCRRALKQRAIRTAYILAVRNHYLTYLCGDFTLLLSWGISPRQFLHFCIFAFFL